LLKIIHFISAVILLISHIVFLTGGIYISYKKLKPRLLDWVSRLTAQISLGAVILSGFILLPVKPLPFFPHIFTGILPLLSIPAVQVMRIILKKRRSMPWFLPVVNLVFIITAFLTGILIMNL